LVLQSSGGISYPISKLPGLFFGTAVVCRPSSVLGPLPHRTQKTAPKKLAPEAPKWGPKISQKGSKIGARGPRWGPKWGPGPPKGSQNRLKSAKMGPEAPRRGRRPTLVRKRGVSAAKGDMVWGAQMVQKSIQKSINNWLLFGPLRAPILTPCCSKIGANIEPSWPENRVQNGDQLRNPYFN